MVVFVTELRTSGSALPIASLVATYLHGPKAGEHERAQGWGAARRPIGSWAATYASE